MTSSTSSTMRSRPRLAEDLEASGLWASYGDAAGPLGYGHARPCANANWEILRTRLARPDGTTDSKSDPERSARWREQNPAPALVGDLFGYPANGPKPQDLRITSEEVEMLAGTRVPSVSLILRVGDQALRLEEWLQEAPADAPHRDHVAQVHGRAADPLARLRAARD